MSDQSQEIVDDWSSIIPENGTITGFAQHESQAVNIGEGRIVQLDCISKLSPLDMMNLYTGMHDATGHRVWMGAYLFAEAMADNAMSVYFTKKRVLELGCGTGVSGIIVLLKCEPSLVYFTDSDPAVLEVCRRNCRRNLPDRKCYALDPLIWGGAKGKEVSSSLGEAFDTVLATDVLYDIGALVPLLQTASEALRTKGVFILSHVPRAQLSDGTSVASREAMETCIKREAAVVGLHLLSVLRPNGLSGWCHGCALNSVPLTEMNDAGAAILIFQKG